MVIPQATDCIMLVLHRAPTWLMVPAHADHPAGVPADLSPRMDSISRVALSICFWRDELEGVLVDDDVHPFELSLSANLCRASRDVYVAPPILIASSLTPRTPRLIQRYTALMCTRRPLLLGGILRGTSRMGIRFSCTMSIMCRFRQATAASHHDFPLVEDFIRPSASSGSRSVR